MKSLRGLGLLGLASMAIGGACALSTTGLETSPGTGGSGTGGSASTTTTSTSSSGSSTTSTTTSTTTSSSGTGGATSSSSGTGGSPCSTGLKPCGNMCVSTDNPMFGCAGAACDPCTNAHGTVACVAGACVPTCDQGFADCNNNPADGCETPLGTTTDCGACGDACTNAHGSTTCDANGKCVPKCDGGFADCNNNPNDGCEADLASITTCGACDVVCTNAHGTTACTGGKCAPTCDQGYADCANPNDGCETPTDADINNCGACGRKCSTSNVASLICSGGLCTSTCVLGRANCNVPPTGNDDGCEDDVASDDSHCGGCLNTCKNANFADDPECDKGSATQKVCGCSNANECKWGANTNPTCDSATGLCTCNNTKCQPSEACKSVNGTDVCTCYGGAACAAGQSCCQNPAGCFNLLADVNNCGACGHVCPPGFNCNGGACGCAANDANCNAGAPAGTFSCMPVTGADLCVCNGTTCTVGQRCLANGTCG